MSLKFIDTDQTSRGGGATYGSTFIVRPKHLEVLGVMEHGHKWRPRTERDRDELATWLQSLDYSEGLNHD